MCACMCVCARAGELPQTGSESLRDAATAHEAGRGQPPQPASQKSAISTPVRLERSGSGYFSLRQKRLSVPDVPSESNAQPADELQGGLADLFMRIDADSDGTVSWDEFLSFVVLNSQALMHARDMVEFRMPATFLPPTSASASSRVHPTPITHIVPLPDAYKVLTCSRDGTLALWEGREMRLERVWANASYLPRGSNSSTPFVAK
ncbi:hypothetical protein T492DRAFT_23610 [Pavlovales sp. CCMP2436]|nr:hypothetical protein T492DRAFT_23610 [Pavlovales sp. CCMP2436]